MHLYRSFCNAPTSPSEYSPSQFLGFNAMNGIAFNFLIRRRLFRKHHKLHLQATFPHGGMFGGELSSRTILPSYSLQIQLFLTMSMRGRPEEELIAMWILYPNTYLSHKYDSTLTKRLYLCSCDVYICSCCASVSLHVYNRKTMLL